jgi:hypothetical protein
MLALDDAALARIFIGASRVPPAERGRWLRKLADVLDPAPAPKPHTLAKRRANAPQPRRVRTSDGAANARFEFVATSPTRLSSKTRT